MKKYLVFAILITAVLAFASCSKPEPRHTPLGDFDYNQEVQASIKDDQNNEFSAGAGNILLITYLTPVKDNNVTMDQAAGYFSGACQAVVDGQTYNKVCMLYVQSGGTVRYGLVFEIPDNNYDNNHQPVVDRLSLPESVNTPTPEPTQAPTTAPTESATPIPTT